MVATVAAGVDTTAAAATSITVSVYGAVLSLSNLVLLLKGQVAACGLHANRSISAPPETNTSRI
jgi:hypothetical protein